MERMSETVTKQETGKYRTPLQVAHFAERYREGTTQGIVIKSSTSKSEVSSSISRKLTKNEDWRGSRSLLEWNRLTGYQRDPCSIVAIAVSQFSTSSAHVLLTAGTGNGVLRVMLVMSRLGGSAAMHCSSVRQASRWYCLTVSRRCRRSRTRRTSCQSKDHPSPSLRC